MSPVNRNVSEKLAVDVPDRFPPLRSKTEDIELTSRAPY
jgi:hypothetical protein